MSKVKSVFVLAILLAMLVSGIQAQESITVGSSIMSEAAGSEVSYSFSPDKGGLFIVTLTSDIFDTLVYVLDSAGDTITFDDDSAGALNSRAIFSASAGETYTISVSSFADDPSGAFELSLDEFPLEPLSAGDSLDGVFTGAISGYLFTVTEPGGYALSLESDEFDGMLTVWDKNHMIIALDDDSGYDLNPWVVVSAPKAGSYYVGISSFSDEAGSYTLNVLPVPIYEFAAETGKVFAGLVSDSFDGGEVAFTVTLEAGRPVFISLVSNDFDTYLSLFDSSGFEAASDDDSGGNYNSLLAYTPSQSGEYTVVVSSFDSASSGEFALSVFDIAPPESNDLDFNFVGAIAAGDVIMGNSLTGIVDIYTLSATVGETFTIALDSDDFDVLLEVRGPGGVVVASDDDSGGNLNALLTFTADADGDYFIGVISYDLSDGAGEYTLSVSD